MLEEYKDNVRTIYDKAARAGVLVVAVTPTLIGEDPTSEKNRVLDQFADFIREEARLRGLPLADPRADEIEALKRFPPDSGLHFTYDGVHPVKAGNELIARSILRALGAGGAE
jgi:lysophospholipase L1-like esterase